MFQPQATPYTLFPSYGGPTPSLHDLSGAQPSAGLVIDSGGPTFFPDPIFRSVPTRSHGGGNSNLPYNDSTHSVPYKMEQDNDIEAQEALARDFQPLLEGSLVGDKKSSSIIAEEYAKADPIYVTKTAALPQTYSHYRPILGDGNCGWRAVGFSYFETLVRSGQSSQLQGEHVRMVSLKNLLTKVGGFEPWLFEDMVDETLSLLRDLAGLVESSTQDAMAVLLHRFNTKDISDSIVYHLRLLASSWLQKEPDKYAGFIADGIGVKGYRASYLEPVNVEIEHLGMTLLIDVLLKPIGISVGIAHLDRSEGSQVNIHLIQPEDERGVPTNPGGPMIHLLYRPSHYDILYKDAAEVQLSHAFTPTTNMTTNIEVQRAFTQPHLEQSTPMHGFPMDMSMLTLVPGFSFGPAPALQQSSFPSYQSPTEASYTPPISTSISPISSNGSCFPPVPNHRLANTFVQPQPTAMATPPLPLPPQSFTPEIQLPIHSTVPVSERTSLPSETPSPSAANTFRPSKYEFAAAADWQEGSMPFQTSTFRNSHFNTAHYNNPHFQPEEWTPESEEPPSLRKRST